MKKELKDALKFYFPSKIFTERREERQKDREE